ncbi:MAG: hypothetical protein V7607_3233 [Solirubrobacteraceae bacterium]
MSPPDDQPRDRLGRRRSPATLPGFRKGKAPANKGRKTKAEVLTESDIELLMTSMSRTSAIGRRNHAIVWLMYRHEAKVGQITAMLRRHYPRDKDHIILPGQQGVGDRKVMLDARTRELLEEWWAARAALRPRPFAPLFCAVAKDASHSPVQGPYLRMMLARTAEEVGIERHVTCEALRVSGIAHRENQARGIGGRVFGYVDEEHFRNRFPEAHSKWRGAFDMCELDAERHATRIGHDSREALNIYAADLVHTHGAKVKPSAGTVDKLRAVIDGQDDLSNRVRAMLRDALIPYWGTISDLAQRQEHGAEREGEDLTGEDGRRVVFQVMLLMYEIDRTLEGVTRAN